MLESQQIPHIELEQIQKELEQARLKIAELEKKLDGTSKLKPFYSGFAPTSSDYFQKVIESSINHIVLLDSNGGILYSNNIEHILGYTIQEYSTLGIISLIHHEDIEQAQKYWQSVITNPNSVQTVVFRTRHRQGHYLWIEVTAINRLDDPEIGVVISSTREISDQKRAEDALQKSEALFRSTFEQVAVGMAHHAPDGQWLRVNNKLCEIVGYDREELQRKSFHDITHPDDLADDVALSEKSLRGEIQTYSIDKRYIHKSGKIVWVRLTVTLIRDSAGEPDHFAVVVEDITQLKETEQALLHSEKRYRQIIEAQEDAICHFRPDYQLTFANAHYAENLLNKRPEEIIGKNVLELIPEPFRPQFITTNEKLNAENLSLRAETSIVKQDGSLGWIEWNHRVILDDAGQPLEYQIVGRDTTQRKQMEDAERKQRQFAEALRDGLAALTVSLDLDEVMQQILKYSVTVVPSDAASISLFEGDYAKIAYVHGITEHEEKSLKAHKFSVPNSVLKDIETTRQPYLVLDTLENDKWVILEANAWIRSSIGVPIIVRNELIGALHIDSKTPKHFDTEDITRLQDFVRYASLAIEHAYYVDHLEERVSERTAELEAHAAEIHDLYNNAPCGYHSLDADGYFVAINDTELQWLGYSREEVVGKLKYSDLCTPQSAQTFGSNFSRFKEKGWLKNIESSLLCKDGSILYILLSSSAIYDENGQFSRGRSTVYDITALKQAQEMVRHQRDLLQLVIDATPTAIVLKGEDGRYEMVNEQTANIYGLTSAEMIGKSDAEIHKNADEVALFAKQDQYVKKSGKTLLVPDSHLGNYYFQTSVVPLKNATGKVERILVVSNDITQRKKIEQALSEQRDFLNLVINNVPDLIFVKDRLGRFEMVNERAAQIYGLAPAQMLGKTDAAINLEPEEVAFYQVKDQEALRTGKSIFIADEPILDRHYQTNKIPLKNAEGQYERLLVVASDITEHKKAEVVLQNALQKEKELGELRSRFISMTSHEFRTPLTAILATTETLRFYRYKLSEEQIDKRLLNIQEQINYLKTIMEDVLQLSKLQTHRIELNMDEFDLNLLCLQLIDELRSEFVVPHQINYSCDSHLKKAYLDKKLMRQIINNLLSNAIKYSPNGTPVSLTLREADQMLYMQISDQGFGIPEVDQKHLFEPFHRATNVGSILGTGLGLTIAKESVDLLGGDIIVQSQLGSGTVFIVQIPLQK